MSKESDPNSSIQSDQNEPWGDRVCAKTPHCRILFQNVNGISSRNNFAEALEIGDQAQRLGVHILGLAETNVDWRHKDGRHKCTQAFRKFWQETAINSSSSEETFDSFYQPGGTMSIVGNPWASRCSLSNNDTALGRWNEISIEGRKNRKLRIFTAYCPVKNTISRAGAQTVYAQQWHILQRRGIVTCDPRKQFITDLSDRVELSIAEGYGVVIMMDANETTAKFNTDLCNWVRRSGLVDPHIHRHGIEGDPATHARGSTRIDYMFTSMDLCPYIAAAGILPFFAFHHSDHRALFLDVDLTRYLHGQPTMLQRPNTRGLVSSDPRSVEKYRKLLLRFLTQSAIKGRVDQLQSDIMSHGMSPRRIELLESLEQEFTFGRLEAAKACTSIRTVPWSPELQDAQHKVRYWKMWLSEKRNKRDFSAERKRLWPQGELEDINPSLQLTQERLRCAQRALYDVHLNAATLRAQHLERRAAMVALEGRLSQEKAIRTIIKSEAMRTVNSNLSRMFNKTNKSGLSHLLVPNESGGFTTIDDPDDIHAKLIERNKCHFSQADGTPFTVEPLVSLFGPYGTNATSQRLLQGEFDIDHLHTTEATKSILRKLIRRIPAGSVRHDLTSGDIREGKRRWRETTSVSPSGLHLGHDKALFRMENEKETGEKLSDVIFGLQATFINLALIHGHVYNRWKSIVNATIEKIPGVPRIDKLRVIHIIESDLNLTFGILLGRRMMATAEAHGALGHEQFGSRSEKTSLVPLLIKYSKYAIARMSKMNLSTFDNDAKSCYDRIVMLLASLCAQRLGVDPSVCSLFLKALDQMEYKIKTKHGISTAHYKTDSQTKIHGPGQGGRASPGIWVIISCLLMECLGEKSTGISLVSPDLLQIIKFFTNGFVDDVTLWTGDMLRSLSTNETPAIILLEMQEAAQWWEELLHATGGKLELQKCFYYLVFWEFDNEGVATLMKPSAYPGTIAITDSGTNQRAAIEVKSSITSHKTLGVLLNPSGCTKDECKRISDKGSGLGRIVGSTHLSQYEAATALTTRINPSITYGLAIGTLTELQAQKIQSGYVRPCIRAMGFNMSTPLAVVFAPKLAGGIGCVHLFAEQGRMKTLLLIQQIRMQTKAGELAIAMFKWAQRIAGTTRPILEDVDRKIPYLDNDQYISSLRRFLALSSMGIHIPQIMVARMPRQNDQMIMDVALNRRPSLTKRTLERINRCRLFLRAEYISDITTADGISIRQKSMLCNRDEIVHSKQLWPRQPHVGRHHRKTWAWFLKSLCKYESASHKLLHPLGPWLRPPPPDGWVLYYDDVGDTIYARFRTHWRLGAIEEKSAGNWKIRISLETVSDAEVRECVSKIPLTIRHLEMDVIQAVPPTSNSDVWTGRLLPRHPRTWRAYVNSLPPSERDVLRHCKEIETLGVEKTLIDYLSDSSVILRAVSVGISLHNRGTFAWSIAAGPKKLWVCTGHARGMPMSTFRANGYGRISWMCFLHHYAKFMGVTVACQVIPYSDNARLTKVTEGTIDLSRSWESTQANYDLVQAIMATQSQLTTNVPQVHRCRLVSSKHTSPPDKVLNSVERAMAQAIRNAKRLFNTISTPTKPSTTIPWVNCSVYLLHKKAPYTNNESDHLRWAWREQVFREYIKETWSLTSSQIAMFDWEAYHKMRSRLSLSQMSFSTKLLIGWLATGSRMEKYGCPVSACPRCGAREDNDHLLRCHAATSDEQATSLDLSQYLESLDTAPGIIIDMVEGVNFWLREGTATPLPPPRPGLQSAVGWRYFMRGILTMDWNQAQCMYWRQKHPTRSNVAARTWSSKVSSWLVTNAQTKWTARNELIHHPSESSESRDQQVVAIQAADLYSQRAADDPVTKPLFHTPLETALLRPLRSLKAWIKSTTKTTSARAALLQLRIQRQHRDIRSYWQSPLEASSIPSTTVDPAPTATPSSRTITPPLAVTQHTQRHRKSKNPPARKSRRRLTQHTKLSAHCSRPATRKQFIQPILKGFGFVSRVIRKAGQDHADSASISSTTTAATTTSHTHVWTDQRLTREGGGSTGQIGRGS